MSNYFNSSANSMRRKSTVTDINQDSGSRLSTQRPVTTNQGISGNENSSKNSQNDFKRNQTHHEAPAFKPFFNNKHFILVQPDDQKIIRSNQEKNVNNTSGEESLVDNSARDSDASRSPGSPRINPKMAKAKKGPAQKSSFYIQALKREFLQSQQRMSNSSVSSPSMTEQQNSSANMVNNLSERFQKSKFNQLDQQNELAEDGSNGQNSNANQQEREVNAQQLQMMNSIQDIPSQGSCDTQEKFDLMMQNFLANNGQNININQLNSVIEQQQSGSSSRQLRLSKPYHDMGEQQSMNNSELYPVIMHKGPFKKTIDKVLSYNTQKSADDCQQLQDTPINGGNALPNYLQGLPDEIKQMIYNASFLIKFTESSYLHSQWMPGSVILENCDQQSVEQLVKFTQIILHSKDKLTSSDENADFVAQKFGQDNQTIQDSQQKSKKISSKLFDMQSQEPPFFNLDYVKVEQVLCASTMYPLLHSSGVKQVADTWKEECLRVLDVLLNVKRENCCFGLNFSAFYPAFSSQYLEDKRQDIESQIGSSFQVLNMTQLQNLLYNKGLTSPFQFWIQLGKLFKAHMIIDEDEHSANRQFCSLLRMLSLFLFRRWQTDCADSYEIFCEDLYSQDRHLDDAFASKNMKSTKNKADRHNQKIGNFHQKAQGNNLNNIDKGAVFNNSRSNSNFNMQMDHPRGASGGRNCPSNLAANTNMISVQNSEMQNPENSMSGGANQMIKLDDIQLFSSILNQNKQILGIQTQLSFDNRNVQEVESLTRTLGLFMENQKLLQNLLLNFQKLHPQINLYEDDVVMAKNNKSGTNDRELINLRNKLLNQNSFALEQFTRKKLLGVSDSSSNQLSGKEKNLLSGSDSSSLEKAPIFIFSLLNNQGGAGGANQGSGDSPKAPQQSAIQDQAAVMPLQLQQSQYSPSKIMISESAEASVSQMQQHNEAMVGNTQSINNQGQVNQQEDVSQLKSKLEQAIALLKKDINQLQPASAKQPNSQQRSTSTLEQPVQSAIRDPKILNLQATIKSFLQTARPPTVNPLQAQQSNTVFNLQQQPDQQQQQSLPAVQQHQQQQQQQIVQYQQQQEQPILHKKSKQDVMMMQNTASNQIQPPSVQQQQPLQQSEAHQVQQQQAAAEQQHHQDSPQKQQTIQQSKAIVEQQQQHDLSWLLFQGEVESEILANPYLFEDDIQSLLTNLFEKEQTKEDNSGNSIDIQKYYLNRNHFQSSSRNTNQLQQFDCLSFEPLFLIKWKSLSYSKITWEPISALKGENLRQVKDFLGEKRQISMRGRLINSKMIQNLELMLQMENQIRSKEFYTYGDVFRQQKALIDQFIVSLCQTSAQSCTNEESKSLAGNRNHPADSLLKSKNFKLLELQKRSLSYLEKAFIGNKNSILADQNGLGKRVTLVNFLTQLKSQFKINGPFLVISTEAKLDHWKHLLNKWTELKALVYHDSDKEQGMENLRRWAVYHLDVTIKGRMTTRNQLLKFDVLLTTAKQIKNLDDSFIRKVPFMQVIVDEAHIQEHREATQLIACKRIICSTSNPIPEQIQDLAELVRCVDPQAMDQFKNPEKVFCEIGSLSQIQSISSALNPYAIKNFQQELENIFGQLNQIELEVQMTQVQRLFYKEIYEQHGDLISKLGSLKELSQAQAEQITMVDELLLKCCNSIFLIDREEKMMEKCQLFSKRELKSNLKQQLVSGKMLVLQQIVENLQKSSKKMIICTHYPHMIALLKKYFKETGVACFMYQPLMSIDSVFRFNLYSGQAVFLLHIGQKWTKQECSHFDLDFIQNVVFFDQVGSQESDLINLFQVSTLPFSIDVNVYRLISENSYEQKLYQRQSRTRKIQNMIFSSQQRNLWNNQSSSKAEEALNMQLEFPLQLSTTEESLGYVDVAQIPVQELDVLLKLSSEQVVIYQSQRKIDKKQKGTKQQKELCFTQMFHDLLTQQEKPPQLQLLIDSAKSKNQKRKSDRLQDLQDSLKSLDQSSVSLFPNLKSANFYYKIFGLDFGTEINKEMICKHLTCRQFFIDKLSETSSVMPNHSSPQGTMADKFRSLSRTRTRESNNISLVKLLKIQGQLGRQYKQKSLFSLDFMKQASQQQPYAAQPVDKIWKLHSHPALHNMGENDNHRSNNGVGSRFQNALINPSKLNLKDSIDLLRNTQVELINTGENLQKMVLETNQNKAIGHNLENSQAIRKPLSEEGRGEINKFADDEEIKELKGEKKTSEDNNTLKKSFGQADDLNGEESDDHTIQIQQDEVSHNDGHSADANNLVAPASIEHSYDMNLRLDQNQPDKKLSNGNVCQICFFLVNDNKKQPKQASNKSVLQCKGPCKNYFHEECARYKGIIVPGSIQPIVKKSKTPAKNLKSSLQLKSIGDNQNMTSENEDGPAEEQESDFNEKKSTAVSIQSFCCINCNRNEAPCYICKKFSVISQQSQAKEKIMSSSQNRSAMTANMTSQKKKSMSITNHGEAGEEYNNQPSYGEQSTEQVEKCIVGSCQKYYHFNCLQSNQNVDIYTNNKNQTRFRCPLHYCSGCSISGNSVQILQCVACPTSYHLKCFRADRGAVKLTKKFILCGQHSNILKKMQRQRTGIPAKTSIAGYSLQQKIEQHKRHYLQQIQIRKQQTRQGEIDSPSESRMMLLPSSQQNNITQQFQNQPSCTQFKRINTTGNRVFLQGASAEIFQNGLHQMNMNGNEQNSILTEHMQLQEQQQQQQQQIMPKRIRKQHHHNHSEEDASSYRSQQKRRKLSSNDNQSCGNQEAPSMNGGQNDQMHGSEALKNFQINTCRDAKASLKVAERVTLALRQLKDGTQQ